MSVRDAYERLGVEEFYREEGAQYTNPHAAQVTALIKRWAQRPHGREILDLCCGSGEVTRSLRSLGEYQVIGLDPYTFEAYERETGLLCLRYTFSEMIRGALDRDDLIRSTAKRPRFDHMICSFALHLCPADQLYTLTYALFKHCQELVIITPHKRPLLESLSGVELKYSLTELTPRGKRVTLKSYQMPHHPEQRG